MTVWRRFSTYAAVLCVCSLAARPCGAFYQWEIKEIFSSADGSVQFIEMFTSAPFGDGLASHNIKAVSDGVTKELIFNSNLTQPTEGKHFLIATAGFGSLAGGVTPNFTIPSNFFNPSATTINFEFAHGWDTLTVAGASIPKDGRNSLTDADTSPDSEIDNLIVGVNSPTNFAGAAGSVNLGGGTAVPGDFTGDGMVNSADLTRWRTNFGAAGSPTVAQGNADGDGDVDGSDFLIWQRNVGASGAAPSVAAIPEPGAFALAITAALAIALGARRASKGELIPTAPPMPKP